MGQNTDFIFSGVSFPSLWKVVGSLKLKDGDEAWKQYYLMCVYVDFLRKEKDRHGVMRQENLGILWSCLGSLDNSRKG